MKSLPSTIHEVKGNHQVALNRTVDISNYLEQAVGYLQKSLTDKDLGAHMRAAMVREADERLDIIIRFANTAKTELRIAYCPD